MNLPVIDIPVKLPFDVPLLVHPVFVHFVIAIPVIVLLIELVNLKTKKPAVSVTSLSLLILAVFVFAGAFFTGKADGSEAFSFLSPEVQDELRSHKLLGTYLVFGAVLVLLLKLGAMIIRKKWMKNVFMGFLVLFIAILFKQGKDGGELVFEYGVNVKPVTELKDRINEMKIDLDNLNEQLQKAKTECEEKSAAVSEPVQSEETTPAVAPEAATESTVSEESSEENATATPTEVETPASQEAVQPEGNSTTQVPIPTH